VHKLESVAGNWSSHTPCVFVRAKHRKLLMGFVCARVPALDDAHDGRYESRRQQIRKVVCLSRMQS